MRCSRPGSEGMMGLLALTVFDSQHEDVQFFQIIYELIKHGFKFQHYSTEEYTYP